MIQYNGPSRIMQGDVANDCNHILQATETWLVEVLDLQKSVIFETLDNKLNTVLWAYKKVANKVCPVPRVLLEEFCIVRCQHPNPLEGMSELLKFLQEFTLTRKLTIKQIQAI